MGISEIFGNSFEVVRKNPRVIWPILLFTLIITAASFGLIGAFVPLSVLTQNSSSPFNMNTSIPAGALSPSAMIALLPALFGVLGLIILISFFVGILITGFYIAIAEQGFKKQKISLNAALDVAKSAYLRLLAAAIIYLIIIVVIVAVFILILIAAIAIPSHSLHIVAGLLLFLIGIVVVVFIGISFYQLYVVVVLEKRDPVEAIKRSMDIGKKLWGEILAVFIISVVIASVIDLIGSLLGVVVGLVFTAVVGGAVGLIMRELVQLIITSFVAAWISLVPVFFYHEYVTSGTKKSKPMKR